LCVIFGGVELVCDLVDLELDLRIVDLELAVAILGLIALLQSMESALSNLL